MKIKDLKPGDVFFDSLGCRLKVEKVEALPWLGIPRTSPKSRVTLVTEGGNRMTQNFRSDREIEVQNSMVG